MIFLPAWSGKFFGREKYSGLSRRYKRKCFCLPAILLSIQLVQAEEQVIPVTASKEPTVSEKVEETEAAQIPLFDERGQKTHQPENYDPKQVFQNEVVVIQARKQEKAGHVQIQPILLGADPFNPFYSALVTGFGLTWYPFERFGFSPIRARFIRAQNSQFPFKVADLGINLDLVFPSGWMDMAGHLQLAHFKGDFGTYGEISGEIELNIAGGALWSENITNQDGKILLNPMGDLGLSFKFFLTHNVGLSLVLEQMWYEEKVRPPHKIQFQSQISQLLTLQGGMYLVL